jgi:transposase
MADQGYKFYIGIDVSKHKLDIAMSNSDNLLQVTNTEAGFKELIKSLPSKTKSLIVLEASGGYEQSVSDHLRRKQFNVAVVNPKRVRDFAKAVGKLAKTDSIDARVIMSFGKAVNPAQQTSISFDEKIRLNYLNRRGQLIKMIALEKQHLEQSTKNLCKQIQRHINFLEKELVRIEEELKVHVKKDPELKEKIERLDAIEGVGEITAMNVLLHMPELGQLTPKEASALAGVAPFNKDSGQSKGRREIRGGRAPVRAALYMSILSARKFNPAIKIFYDRLIKKGKLKKVAMVACMRKLIIVMNAMMRDGATYSPNHL